MTDAAADDIPARRWPHATAPRRILAIRFQALGDTMITLPYLLGVRRRYPDAELHFLTREEVATVPKAMTQFDRVVALGGDRNRFRTWLSALRHTPALLAGRYDVVLDLQNSRISNFVRRAIRPEAWSAFDRFSPRSAGERTRRTIAAALGVDAGMDTALELRGGGPDIDALLLRHGWKAGFDLVVLNPAGFSPARAWPTASYIEFARLWIERHPRSQVVLLLMPVETRQGHGDLHCPRRALHRSHGPCGPARSFRDRRAGAVRAVGRLGSHAHGLDPGNTHARTLQRQPARLVGAAGELERLPRFLGPALRALRTSGLQVRRQPLSHALSRGPGPRTRGEARSRASRLMRLDAESRC